MTCHLAFSGKAGAVLFSDSQASTAESEFHGIQKQYAGTDFLVGGAGSVDVINAVFEALQDQPSMGSAAVEDFFVRFSEDNLTAAARASVKFMVVASHAKPEIFEFSPGVFRRFRKRGSYASIGSGADFVHRAIGRDHAIGVPLDLGETIAHTLAAAESYFAVTNESLTVDDQVMVGLLLNGRTYLMGDQRIQAPFLSDPLKPNWPLIGSKFREISAALTTLRSQIRATETVLHPVRYGMIGKDTVDTLVGLLGEIANMREQVHSLLQQYIVWYDETMART